MILETSRAVIPGRSARRAGRAALGITPSLRSAATDRRRNPAARSALHERSAQSAGPINMPKFAPRWVFCSSQAASRRAGRKDTKRGFDRQRRIAMAGGFFREPTLVARRQNGGNWVEDAELKARYCATAHRSAVSCSAVHLGYRGQTRPGFGNRTRGSDAHVTNGARSPIPATMKCQWVPNPDITAMNSAPIPMSRV